MENFVAAIIRYRKAVLVICTIITIACVLKLRSLSVIVDVDNLLPNNHDYVITNRIVEEVFGNKFVFVINITAKDGSVLHPEILKKVQIISEKIKNVEGVKANKVFSLTSPKVKSIKGNAEGMEVRTFLPASGEIEINESVLSADLRANPVYEGLLYSKDLKTTQILAEVVPIKGKMTPVVSAVRKLVEAETDDTVKVSLGGAPIFLALSERFSSRMGILFPIALILIGLIHFEAFRTIQAMILPLVTALLAVIWALGFLSMIGKNLDVFNSATPILILAVAAGHAVQILKRYYEEYARLRNDSTLSISDIEKNRMAVHSSLVKVGPVMIAACLVAVAGFMSLVFFDIQSIKVFGIFTSIGILSALVLEFTFIPAIRSSLKPPSLVESTKEKERTFWDSIIDKFYVMSMQKRKQIAFASVVLIGVALFGASRVVMENSVRIYYDKDILERQDDAQINNTMGGTSVLLLLIDGGTADSVKNTQTLRAMDGLQRYLESDPFVGKTVSIVDFLKKMNQSLNENQESYFKVPESSDLVGQYLFLYANSGDPGDFDSYVDNDYQRALIQIYIKNDNSVRIGELVSKIQTYVNSNFDSSVRVSVGGSSAGSVALNEIMIRSKVINILQIMGAVFLITSLLFRSIVAGLFILIPLAAAVLLNFGLMGILSIPMQIATAVVSALAVGIGADYGIYLVYRIREEIQRSNSEEIALRDAYKSAGKAVLFVSSAVAGGFGVLMLSLGYAVHVWMGLFVSFATLVSSIAALTLIPAAIAGFRPNFIYKYRKAV